MHTPPISRYDHIQTELCNDRKTWLITGAAGFIGSHLVEKLLRLDQKVAGLDNLSTGKRGNLDEVQTLVSAAQWARFRFIESDICNLDECHKACAGVDYILHQAALGSVPSSLKDPLRFHQSNVSGFVNIMLAARDAQVKRLVYASSSAVYGDHPGVPAVEQEIGRPLSPYAATKLINEVYAGTFFRSYSLPVVGLRYFNIFGPRQDPSGAYAAVIPKWFAAAREGEAVFINGDGETTRDFCYISDVVQANLLAVTTSSVNAVGKVYNVAVGCRTTLNELFVQIRARVASVQPTAAVLEPKYLPERAGDVRHSLAAIHLAQAQLGYAPAYDLVKGLQEAGAWYLRPRGQS